MDFVTRYRRQVRDNFIHLHQGWKRPEGTRPVSALRGVASSVAEGPCRLLTYILVGRTEKSDKNRNSTSLYHHTGMIGCTRCYVGKGPGSFELQRLNSKVNTCLKKKIGLTFQGFLNTSKMEWSDGQHQALSINHPSGRTGLSSSCRNSTNLTTTPESITA